LVTADGRRPARAGDVVGVRAAFGAPTGAVIEAVEPTELWVLSPEALDELMRRHPSIGAARAGRSTMTSAPAGTLIRSTMGAGATTTTPDPRRTVP
jgi:hypothetical protein